jgi:hypothetical protein
MSITALRTITEAAEYPVSLDEAKAHLRITHNAEDAYIQSLIAAATDWAQVFLSRILIDTQVHLRMDRFPESGDAAELQGDPLSQWFTVVKSASRKRESQKRDKSILLPGGNVTAVNDIDYFDELDVAQTLTGPTSATPGTDYTEDLTDDEWAFVYAIPSVGWPAVSSESVNAVQIDYQVGWLSSADVPESIKHAIRFKIADLFTIRDTQDAGSKSKLLTVAENMLEPYVVPEY